MAQSILIVDDEKEIVSMLYCYFSKLGYTVYTATAGNAALKEVEKKPDIILLDVNMPDIDGFTVCERIRDYVSCPIIFLTARIEDSDKIKGFSIGADDYVIKPFSVDELEARIAAHLRREKRHNISSKVQFDEDMVIDYSSRIVFYHNKDMAFTKKEFDIISFLSQNKGIVFDRETIYEKVWGLANGAAPKDVQELLGHSDVSTTMNVYAHSTRDAKRKSVRLLDKVVGND